MAVELATAYVSLVPSLKGAQGSIARELGGSGMQTQAQRAGRGLGSRILKGITAAAAAAGGIAAAIGLRNLGRDAIESASGIQSATATLSGLLGSAEDATTTMRALRDVARDSPINYQAYLKGGESLAYMGYQGEEAADILKNVGAAVTAAGGDDEGMNRATDAMLNMVNSGKVYADQLNQISATGVPIFSGLAEHFNTNIANVREMVQSGKVGIDDVMAVIQNAEGDTFQSMLDASDQASETFANQWAMAKDNIVTSLGESLAPALDALAPVIGDLGVMFEGMAGSVGDWLESAAGRLADFIQEFRDGEGAGGKFRDVLEKVRDAIQTGFNFVKDTAIPAARDLWDWMVKQQDWLVPIAAGIGAIIAAWKIYRTTVAIVQAAQLILNAVMAANPIAIVVLAIAGLVAAFVVAYKKSETFRKIVDAAWAGIKKAANVVWSFLRDKVFKPLVKWFADTGKRFGAMKDTLVRAWNTVKDRLRAGWDWIKKNVFQRFMDFMGRLRADFKVKVDRIRAIWNAIKSAFRAVVDWVKRHTIDAFIASVQNLRDRIRASVQRIKDIWSGIKQSFRSVVDWVKRNVVDRFKNTLDGLLNKVRTIRDRIGDAWRGIANKFRNPINWVINRVWNDGLAGAFNRAASAIGISTRLPDAVQIPAFAKGGRHKGGWALVGEEGPELVNFSDPGRVYTAEQTRAALAGHGDSVGVPAIGDLWGTVSGWVSNAVDWVRGGLASAASALLNPIKTLIGNTVGQWGTFGRMGGDVAKKAIDGVIDWIKGKDDDFSDDGTAPPLQGGWRRPSRGPITSGFGPRWGSFHAGIDVAGGGPTYAARAGQVAKTGWNIGPGRTGIGILLNHGGGTYTYYGHNPPGGVKVAAGDAVRSGQRIGTQGATGNVTGTHVHFELHRGGAWRAVNPRQLGVFDNGGWIPHGGMAMNLSGKPEAVLDPAESAALKAGLGTGGGPLVGQLIVRDERTAIDELERMRRRELTRARIQGVRR